MGVFVAILVIGAIISLLLLSGSSESAQSERQRQEIQRIAIHMNHERRQIDAAARQRIAAATREASRQAQRRR